MSYSLKSLKWAIVLLGCLLPSAISARAGEVDLCATFSSAGSDYATGIYSISDKEPMELTLIKSTNEVKDLMNAVYHDGKLYGFFTKTNAWYQPEYYLRVIDVETGESTTNSIKAENYGQAAAYNPVTKKIVGFSGFVKKAFELDPATLQFTTLEFDCQNKLFNSFAINAMGELYATAFGSENMVVLYNIDMANNRIVTIGETGVTSGTNYMTFDRASGKLFLATLPRWGSGASFHTVDLLTGVATRYADLPGDVKPVMSSLFVREQAASTETNHPGLPTDLTTTFKSLGSKEAVISAVAPTKAIDQETDLVGEMTLTFFVDDVEAGSCDGIKPGETASIEYTFETEGTHWVRVTTRNNVGNGLSAQKNTFVGVDVPDKVVEPTFAVDTDGNAKVIWSAPKSGVNNGMYDAGALRYDVVAYPSGKAVATGLDKAEVDTKISMLYHNNYYFGITPVCGEKRGAEAFTNKIKFGEGVRLPYVENFTNTDTWELHTIIDENNDGTWAIVGNSDNARCRYPATIRNQACDWLFTPPVKMRAGVTYQLEVNYAGAFNSATSMNIYLMDKTEVPYGGTAVLTPLSAIACSDNTPNTNTITVTPETDGIRYFAFYTDNFPYRNFDIFKYIITVNSTYDSPADVTDLKVKPADKGVISSVVSFTAPTVRNDGSKLGQEELTAIEIYKGSEKIPVMVFDYPEPGKAYEWTDTAAFHGLNSYTVACFSDKGNSSGVSTETWIGEDIASAVRDLKSSIDKDTDVIKVTWKTPEGGYQGGYVNFDALTYSLSIFVSATTEDYITIQEGITECEAEIRLSDIRQWIPQENEGRASLSIMISPVTSAGKGYPAITSVILGDHYKLPFAESFGGPDGPATSTDPWTIKRIEGNGNCFFAVKEGPKNVSLEGLQPQDGDNGMVMFYENKAAFGEARFQGPVIDIEGTRPVIAFWLYHRSATDKENNFIVVETIDKDGQYVEISDRIAVDGFGWKLHEIDLSEMMPEDLESMQLIFHARATGGSEFFLDNIRITDGMDDTYPEPRNLVATLSADKSTVTLAWEAPEAGKQPVIGYYIYCDGEKVSDEYTTETTYTIAFPAGNEAHYYEVQAIYNDGDSRMSNRAFVDPTSVSEIGSDTAKVYTEAGQIVIEADGLSFSIVAVSGSIVAEGTVNGRSTVAVPAGIYLVKIGRTVAKVAVN